MSVSPIPPGHHTLTPHLQMEDAAAAIEFYESAFGAEEVSRMPAPDGTWIMHAQLRLGDSMLFLNDVPPSIAASGEMAGRSPAGLHLYVDNADAVFAQAVEAGAEVVYPMEDTFWGDRFGKVRDPFGFDWGIATRIEELTAEQIAQRAEDFFKQRQAAR